MSVFKRGLGMLAAAAVLCAVNVPMTASAAFATSMASWHEIMSYRPTTPANLAQCRADGKNYGGTWQCKYYPSSWKPYYGQPHYELQVYY